MRSKFLRLSTRISTRIYTNNKLIFLPKKRFFGTTKKKLLRSHQKSLKKNKRGLNDSFPEDKGNCQGSFPRDKGGCHGSFQGD